MRNMLLSLFVTFICTQACAQNLVSPKYVTSMLDSLTLAARDTTFPAQPAKRWDSFTFYFTVDGAYKIGAPDTSGWSSKHWLPAAAYMPIAIGSATPLTRIAYKAAGTAGQIVMLGTSGKR